MLTLIKNGEVYAPITRQKDLLIVDKKTLYC